MKNRNNKYKLSYIVGVLIMALTLGSCEKYLDKAPEATITEKDAFGSFKSFQGFVEEMYYCITDYDVINSQVWNNFWSADEVLNADQLYDHDKGDVITWSVLMPCGTGVVTNDEARAKRIWPLCWYGIRKANMTLQKLPLLLNATQEEKDLIKGQALFFRGWFYHELMRYWGGLPYLDTLLSVSNDYKVPRLNYKETALKAAKDLRRAADLLPVDWDNILAGQATLGNNHQRASKVMALAFLGKDLLYAGSPLMNEESTGSATFNAELCKQAAAAFAEAIDICNRTGAYKLQTGATRTDNFWVDSPGRTLLPGGTEVIMNTPPYGATYVTGMSFIPAMGSGRAGVEVPSANYVKNYGMANGLAIDDPLSGYNPNDPWKNRDPRFYTDIIVDGDELAANAAAGVNRYAQLYNGGRHKMGGSVTNGSVTGYFYKKWCPKGMNQWDKRQNNFLTYIPKMRLADVYLMYAEAVLQGYGTPQSSVPGSGLTAEQALNIVRNRAAVPNVNSRFTASKEAFMEVIIRERAVELAFEGNRYCDLRRWLIATQTKYKLKTALDFDRNSNGKPINITERIIGTRIFEKKHYWVPFLLSYTTLYEEFPQNPGW